MASRPDVRAEFVLRVTAGLCGAARQREPRPADRRDRGAGDRVEVLNAAETPPFPINLETELSEVTGSATAISTYAVREWRATSACATAS